MNAPTPQRAKFTNMQNGTADDWAIIATKSVDFSRELPGRVLAHLRLLEGDAGGFIVDRLQHSLQTATLAHRGGEDDEYVVCALLHDIGDTLGCYNHADVAAAVLKPFVSEENHWMVEKHAVFQGYYFFHYLGMNRNVRDQFTGHPWYERTRLFCEKYDSPAFDPKGETLPLEFFEPMVHRVFAAPKRTLYTNMVEQAAQSE